MKILPLLSTKKLKTAKTKKFLKALMAEKFLMEMGVVKASGEGCFFLLPAGARKQ